MRHVRSRLQELHQVLTDIETAGSKQELRLALQLLEKWKLWLEDDIWRLLTDEEWRRNDRRAGWGEPPSGK